MPRPARPTINGSKRRTDAAARPDTGGAEAGRWQSVAVHFETPAAVDDYLASDLPGVLERLRAERGRFRFFYIQYWDDGLQLRLRFRFPAGQPAAGVLNAVRDAVRQRPGGATTVEPQVYDRTELYFGETLQSVYAELLNEQSSLLALKILRSTRERRGVRFPVTAATLLLALTTACRGAEAREQLADAQAFVAGVLAAYDAPPRARLTPERFAETIQSVLPSVRAGIAADPSFRQWTRLLRRARRAPDNRPVATHALHLLVNKTGFSIPEEHLALQALAVCLPDALPTSSL